MTKVTKLLRLNKFQDVAIPSKKELFKQYGFRKIANAGSTSIDEFTTPATLPDQLGTNGTLSMGADLLRGQRAYATYMEQQHAISAASLGAADNKPDGEAKTE